MGIDIDFRGCTCYFTELSEYFREINRENLSKGDRLYYSSYSVDAYYDFIVVDVGERVRLIAVW